MPTLNDLGQLVKTKYPAYQNMDDAQLGQMVQAKYPGSYDQFQGVAETNHGGFGDVLKGGLKGIGQVGENVSNAVLRPISNFVTGGNQAPQNSPQLQATNTAQKIGKFFGESLPYALAPELAPEYAAASLGARMAAGGVAAGVTAGVQGQNPVVAGLAGAGAPLLEAGAQGLANKGARLLGTTSGGGKEGAQMIFNQAQKGEKGAISAARGTGEDAYAGFNKAIDNLHEARTTNYQTSMAALPKEGVPMEKLQGFADGIQKKMSEFGVKIEPDGFLDFSGSKIPASEQSKVQRLFKSVSDWEDITPTGLDRLQQRIGNEFSNTDVSRALFADSRNTLSQTIKDNVPGYEKLTGDYQEKSQLLRDVKQQLNSKNPETALKKLTKAMSDDGGFRKEVLKELSQYGEGDLLSNLGGAAFQDYMPKGKALSIDEFLSIPTLLLHPHLLPAFLTSSPRVVAEFLNASGVSAKYISKLTPILEALGKRGVNAGSEGNPSPQHKSLEVKK